MTVNIRAFLNIPVHGDPRRDAPLFEAANRIVMNPDATRSQKRVAVRRLYEAMGYNNDRVTDDDVKAYIDAHKH